MSNQTLYDEYRQKVSDEDNPSDSLYQQLQQKRTRTDSELLSLRKGELCRRYATEAISPDLVKKDGDGWHLKILLHFFLTLGEEQLPQRDRQTLKKLKEQGQGQVFKPDVNKSLLSAQVEALRCLGIEQFLDPNQTFTRDSLAEWFERLVQPIPRSQIKGILGVTLSEKDTPIAAAQRLLSLMDLKLELVYWKRINGQAKRVYRGCNVNPDGRQDIFERWLKREPGKDFLAA